MTSFNILKRYWKNNEFILRLSARRKLASLIKNHSLNSLFSNREFLVYKKFQNTNRKEEWLYGRFILKDLVNSHFSKKTIEPLNKIEVVASGRYKPEIVLRGEKLYVDHSLSHSKDLFLAVLAKRINVLIGADIEQIRDVKLTSLSYFLNRREIDEIKKLELNKRQALYFQYWTIKEATLKALGIGLQGSMKGIVVNAIENHHASITISKYNLQSAKVKGEIDINCYSSVINDYAISVSTITILNL